MARHFKPFTVARRRFAGAALMTGGLAIVAAGTMMTAGPAAAAPSCSAGDCLSISGGNGQTVATGNWSADMAVTLTNGSAPIPGVGVEFSVDPASTGTGVFMTGATSWPLTNASGVADAAIQVTGTGSPLLVDASWPSAACPAPTTTSQLITAPIVTAATCSISVQFTITVPAETTSTTTPSSTPTTVSDGSPPPYTCIGAGCGVQPTTTVAPVVTPVVLPEQAPPTTLATGQVLAAAALASTGANTGALTAIGAALVAFGLVVLALGGRRLRPVRDKR